MVTQVCQKISHKKFQQFQRKEEYVVLPVHPFCGSYTSHTFHKFGTTIPRLSRLPLQHLTCASTLAASSSTLQVWVPWAGLSLLAPRAYHTQRQIRTRSWWGQREGGRETRKLAETRNTGWTPTFIFPFICSPLAFLVTQMVTGDNSNISKFALVLNYDE